MIKLTQLMNNFHKCEINGIIVWFSYETPIAFERANGIVVVSKNEWGRTTGKHINHIKREEEHVQLSREEFVDELTIFI